MRPSSATARVNSSPAEAALEYRARGMWVTPTAGKSPILDDWPNLRLEEDAETARRVRADPEGWVAVSYDEEWHDLRGRFLEMMKDEARRLRE